METVLGFVLVMDTCPGLVIFDVVPHLFPEIFCPLVMPCLEDWVINTEGFEVTGLIQPKELLPRSLAPPSALHIEEA